MSKPDFCPQCGRKTVEVATTGTGKKLYVCLSCHWSLPQENLEPQKPQESKTGKVRLED